jgi:hypothetical protein
MTPLTDTLLLGFGISAYMGLNRSPGVVKQLEYGGRGAAA